MEENEKQNLYKRAVEFWGVELQADMCIEEASEFIQAICKIKRRQKPKPELITRLSDEMADMEIMLEQAKSPQMFNNAEEVAKIKEEKLMRLKERLKVTELSNQQGQGR